jgi:anti-sigma B factor antagonist
VSTHLHIDQEPVQDGRASLRLRGAVDVYSSPRLRAALIEAVEAGAQGVVVDLREVTFVDSAGFSALMSGAKRLPSDDGHLGLVTTDESVIRMLRIMGLTDALPVSPTHEDAWASLGAR